MQSILADDIEVKLCKDCRQSICYDEAKKIVDAEMVKIKKLITEKEDELKLLKFYFDALAYGRCLKADE